MKFDDVIVNYIGEFGLYQKTQLFLLCLPSLITSINALSWTFAGADVLHRCRLDNEAVNSHDYWGAPNTLFNTSCKNIKNHPEWLGCPFDECNFQNGTKCSETGNGYIFDRSLVSYSAVERWEFVCDWSILKAVIQSAYYVGQMAGSLVFGFLGDRIGRRYVFFIALILQIIGTTGLAISPHWLLYGLFRVCVGFAHPGIFVIAVIISIEMVGPTKRKMAAAFTGIFFALGQVLLGTLAYFVRNYQLLHAYVTIPAIFFLSYWWIIPESARWLISQKRYEEADKVMRKAARMNGKQLPERWWQDIDDYTHTNESRPARKHNYLDLVRTPRIRTISLATFFCWPVVSMVYYGMSMKTDFLGGDMYITFIFGGFVEIPALLLMFSIVDRVGRKTIICCGYSIAAICMLSNLWMNTEKGFLFFELFYLTFKNSLRSTYCYISGTVSYWKSCNYINVCYTLYNYSRIVSNSDQKYGYRSVFIDRKSGCHYRLFHDDVACTKIR
jgi:OCT family organic cation transporter-like MFS transporter 4/5